MLRAIPDVDVSIRRPCCNDVRILRLIPCLVDLARVDDLLHDGKVDGLLRCTVSAELFFFRVVVGEGRGWWDG